MAKTKIVGDFEYPAEDIWPYTIRYVGPTGRGSVATVPAIVDGRIFDDYKYTAALEGKDIETLSLGMELELKNMPSLKHIVYHVEKVKAFRQGHVTFGEEVKEIQRMEVAEVLADTSVSEYGLPKRIDFLSPIPPAIRTVSPGSISEAELHVPSGAIRTYSEHSQWKHAPVFIDADGKTVVNTSSLESRLRKLKLAREKAEEEKRIADEKAQEKAIEEAKQEKIRTMGEVLHRNLGPQRLARWNPEILRDDYYEIRYKVNVGCFTLRITVAKDAPFSVWDKIVSQLEFIEKEQL